MSVNTEYKCDKCGHSQATPDQIWSVAVFIFSSPGRIGAGSYETAHKHKDWCRACMERYDLLPKHNIKPEEVKKDLTLEDLVREIVRQELPQ